MVHNDADHRYSSQSVHARAMPDHWRAQAVVQDAAAPLPSESSLDWLWLSLLSSMADGSSRNAFHEGAVIAMLPRSASRGTNRPPNGIEPRLSQNGLSPNGYGGRLR
eukprot:1090515-Pyramimonas_sp.AAC.1